MALLSLAPLAFAVDVRAPRTEPILVRDLTGPDIDAGFLDTLANLAEVKITTAQANQVLQKRLRAGVRTFIALKQKQIVGTATLLLEHKFIHSGGRVGHIEDVAVHRDFQGLGIGSLLVRHAVEQTRLAGCYKVLLSCFDDRVPFYEKLGFRRHDVGMRADF